MARGTWASPPRPAWRASGIRVTCADLDEQRVRALGKGEVPILEEGLPDAGRRRPRRRPPPLRGRRRARRERRRVRVPVRADTAVGDGRGRPLRVEAVVREIAPVLRAGGGRRQQVDDAGRLHPTGRARAGQPARPNDVGVASNPEFLREGNAVATSSSRPRRDRVRRRRGRGPRPELYATCRRRSSSPTPRRRR